MYKYVHPFHRSQSPPTLPTTPTKDQSQKKPAPNQTTSSPKMSSLTYTQPPGFANALSDRTHYSQAVYLPTSPPTIKTSGQGPWDPSSPTGSISTPQSRAELFAQVDRAFSNVEATLQSAGSKGWGDVYLARMFYVVPGEYGGEEWKRGMEEVVEVGGEVLRKWCPGHRPLLTAVEVKGLAAEGMRVEVEVEAMLLE